MTEEMTPQENPAKDPEDWVTGDEPMTGPQRSYLQTLAREAGRDVDVDALSKADASKLIDELQVVSGRGPGTASRPARAAAADGPRAGAAVAARSARAGPGPARPGTRTGRSSPRRRAWSAGRRS